MAKKPNAGDLVAPLSVLKVFPPIPGGGEGEPGKSAYEIAVDAGFVGDEAAWLASLQGEPGAAGNDGEPGADGDDGLPGEDGLSAYEIALAEGFVGDETAWLASLQGDPGADGADGADGATWYSGSGAPAGGLGVDGDFYHRTDTNSYYGPKISGAWGSPTSLVGPAGDAGDPGSDGVDGLSAYEIAVANGFVGDEEAWLASLQGEPGESSEDVTQSKAVLAPADYFFIFDSEHDPEDPEDHPFKQFSWEDFLTSVPGGGGGLGNPVSVTHNGAGDDPVVGDTLTAHFVSGWFGDVQWERDNVPISGATSATYTLIEDDAETYVAPAVSNLGFVAPGFNVPALSGGGGGPLALGNTPASNEQYGNVITLTIPAVGMGNSLIILAHNNVADTRVDGATEVSDAEPMLFGILGHVFYIENITDGRTSLTLRTFDGSEVPLDASTVWAVFEVDSAAIGPASEPASSGVESNGTALDQAFTTTLPDAAAFFLGNLSNAADTGSGGGWTGLGTATYAPYGYNMDVGEAGAKVCGLTISAERNRGMLVASFVRS